MVGLREVDELEVEREGARQQNGAVDGQRMDQIERRGSVACGLLLVSAGFGVATADGALAKRFHVRIEVLAGLFAQYLAQQHAQRAHVATQRSFLCLAGGGFQFSQTLRPVDRRPE